MMKLDPMYPMADLKSNACTTKPENIFDINTNKKSLTQTPATKLIPPAFPLLMLCLTTVMITGPTDSARKRPRPMPFMIDSINVSRFSAMKLWI